MWGAGPKSTRPHAAYMQSVPNCMLEEQARFFPRREMPPAHQFPNMRRADDSRNGTTSTHKAPTGLALHAKPATSQPPTSAAQHTIEWRQEAWVHNAMSLRVDEKGECRRITYLYMPCSPTSCAMLASDASPPCPVYELALRHRMRACLLCEFS